jgi:hypothetical protein
MITLLYNLDTQTPGDFREGRYIVDGKTGIFPSNYVELEFQDPQNPVFDETTQKIEYSSYRADMNSLLWTRNASVVQKTPEELTKDQAKQKENAFQNAIRDGYTIPGTQIKLGISDKDRRAWNELITLSNELVSLGQMQMSTPMDIADMDGVSHSYTLSQVKEILAGLGLHYYSLWIQRNTV